MPKVGLVIDSTTILDLAVVNKYQIEVVSLNVTFEEETYKEVDLSDAFVIDRLNHVRGVKTGSPSPYDFEQAYQHLFEKGFDQIVVVPLSKEISSTYQTAVMAKEDSPRKDHIFIVDTQIANFGVANLVEASLDLFNGQYSGAQIAEEITTRAKNSRLLFSISDLKHLFRSGRLSRIGATFAEILKIKPVVKMIDGKLAVIDKTRSYTRILEIFLTTVAEVADQFKNVYIKVVHLQNDAIMATLVDQVKERFSSAKVSIIDRVNPVFLTHLGNNGIGITVTAY
jgi:DegV family protein with EDD domain